MAINVSSGGFISPKVLARQASQQESVKNSDSRQADALKADDTSPGAEVQRFVQSTDEMSVAMAQFRNRRDLDKKFSNLSDSFERVLEDDSLPKAKQIIKVAKLYGVSAEELLRQARGLFPDDSDLVLVLRELLRRRQLDEIVRKKLQLLLKTVEEQADPKLLKAGINCALKARLFGKTLALKPGLLRASYRQFIQNDAPEIEVYSDWISSYGYKHRLIVLDFIEGALLTDIDSQDASCSNIEFGYLLGRLSQLKLLRSADLLFIGALLSDSSIRRFNEDESSWILLMLSLLQNAQDVDALLADTVGSKAVLMGHKEHACLLQVLYMACKSLPSSLFYEECWQEELLEALRRMTDIAHQYELAEQRFKVSENLFDRTNQDK